MPEAFSVARMSMRLIVLGEAARRGAEKGLFHATEHVLGVSRDRVPIEEGTLEGSGTTHVDAGELTGYVYYDTPYAVPQHEDLTFAHDAGRQAKYLESAFNSESGQIKKLVGGAIQEEFT